MATVRLEELAALSGIARDSIKDCQKVNRTPWDDSEFSRDRRRRYDARHAVGLVLREMIAGYGFTLGDAAEAIAFQVDVIDRYLNAAQAGGAAEAYIVAARIPVLDSLTGARWKPHFADDWGTADAIATFLREGLARVGRVRKTRDGQTEERIIGAPHLGVANMSEAYRILKARAERAGFVIDGRRIFAIAQADSED